VVKICGLTRAEDVRLARDLGAWALGFVFAPSPRRLTPAAARGLIRAVREAPEGRRPPLAIGVFGDEPAEEIALIVREAGLDGVQLHGLAGPRAEEVRAAVGRRDGPLLIVKALPVAPDATRLDDLAATVAAAGEEADVVLLDTKTTGRFGGSGTAFPWRLAREVAGVVPLLVAGGIGPGNARAALGESEAWGVDVSSGVELAPGVKDAGLLARLFAEMDAATCLAPAGRHAATDERQEGPRR
jgi:phosphoribosylanthranilate isomerase